MKFNVNTKLSFNIIHAHIEEMGRIPQRIVTRILDEIEARMPKFKGEMRKSIGWMIRDDGDYCVTIKTRFHRSKAKNGILFHIVVLLHEANVRIGHFVHHVRNDVRRATIAVRPAVLNLSVNYLN